MAKNIRPENFSKELMKYLTEYQEDIEEETQEVTKKVGKEAKSELKAISPKRTGDYAKGWTIRTYKESQRFFFKIHNKTEYRLTHLLEFGHVNRDGRTRARKFPHVQPTEEKYMKKFIDELEMKIKRS